MASALLRLAVLALLVAAACAATVVTFNKDGSLSFDGYTLLTDGSVVDAKGKPVAVTTNADGSLSVAGVYSAFPNGTLTAPGVAIYTGDLVGLTMGTTTLYADGTVTDATGSPLFGTVNPDKSYTVGDVTGWANGTVVGPDGVVVNTGLPLSVDPTTGMVNGISPPAAAPAPAPAAPAPPVKVDTVITINPDRTLSFAGYKLLKNVTVLDANGAVATPAANADGSITIGGVYTAYPNKTLIAPGVTVTFGELIKITVGSTSVFSDGSVLDAAGDALYGTVGKDGSFSVGDFKLGWSNGSFVANNGAVVHTNLQLAADPATGIISVLTPSPPPAPTASPPPPPKPASARAAPASFVAAAVALAAPFLLL
ncbi:hypothetical protein CLOP_g13207 [Closterium sp. NIES-67]|nr:hypothetical protein CLOP_g13207 [Closterium sp. NIES-67]